MRLSRFIVQHKELVLQEWEDFARTIEPPAFTMDTDSLRDDASRMLDTIAEDLNRPQTLRQQRQKSWGQGPRSSKETYAEQHAAQRLAAGYTIEQLISEYRALRASVLKLWAKDCKDVLALHTDDVTRFNEAIDQALAESVARFSQIMTDAAETERHRLKALLEAAPVGIAVVDSNKKLIAANAESKRIFGAPLLPGLSNERDTSNGLWNDGVEKHEKQLSAYEQVTTRALSGDVAVRQIIETESSNSLEKRRIVQVNAAPYHDTDSKVIGAVIVQMDITDQLKTEAALRESEAKFRTIADAMPQMVWSTLPDGFHDYYNQQWYDFTGVPFGSTDGEGWNYMFHPEDQEIAWKKWRHSLATGEPYEIQYRLRHRSGEYRWTLGRALPVRDEAGKIIRWMGTCTDIHDQKLAEEELRKQTQKLQLATEAAGIGLFDHDFVRDEFVWDAKLYAHYGLPLDTRITREILFDQMHPDDREKMRTIFENIWASSRNERFQLEYRTVAADGEARWIEVKGRVFVGGDGRPMRLIGTVIDITERKHTEKQMQEAAQHDSLTGLPNRALLYDYCSHILARSARSNESGAVLFIDLDRFKPINDMYGHDVGDKVLQEVAKRLLGCSRKEDIVSRLGGDEFIVVLPRIGSARDAAIVANHMLDAVADPIWVGTMRISISPSIGISLFPEHATNLELLIRCADMAMYAAKRDGRNNFRIYSTGLIDDANGLLRLEVLLKQAVETNTLALFYQPILDTQSRELIGVEALIRIPAEDGLLLGPAEFIPVAETTGLMNRVGDWVIRQACLQHRNWRESGLPPVMIAINVSPMQFRQPTFVSVLSEAIKEFGVEPAFLQIEVTESAIMDDVPDTVETLNRLQAMGIRIALDDFGTGYSSLSHLSNLPLNKLKIDQSFIRKMANNPSSRSITEAIIGLGRTLNLKVVGEGIESEEAMEFLRDHGCDQVQGFLFSRPLPPAEFVTWCRNHSVH